MKRRALRTFAILMLIAPTACGGGGDGTEPAAPAGSPTANNVAFCQALFDLLAASDDDLGINPEKSTRKEILEASIRWYGSDKAEGLMASAEENAPAALVDEVSTLTSGLRKFGETGDLKTTEKAIGSAQRRIGAYQSKECPER